MATTIRYWGYRRIMEKNMETTIRYWGSIGIMEKVIGTTIGYWGYIRIMEKKMETAIVSRACIAEFWVWGLEPTVIDRTCRFQ